MRGANRARRRGATLPELFAFQYRRRPFHPPHCLSALFIRDVLDMVWNARGGNAACRDWNLLRTVLNTRDGNVTIACSPMVVAGHLWPEALPCGQVVVLVATSDEAARLPALPSRAQEADVLVLAPRQAEF